MAATFSKPPSFSEATVFCLPKVSTPRNGLDYRPISLLNTDYKIFSRLVLLRVTQRVSKTVSTAQFGFVGRRQVHDAIDVWDAVQAMVTAGELPRASTAIMRDFAKAYDTLDRSFLRQALEFHGFPSHVISTVDEMHMATTARYLAEGDLSAVVDIHNGIRQGRPLAPVLFTLALDLLYQAADTDAALSGLQLDPTTTVKLSGYADDMTAYIAHPREEPALLQLLAEFGAASGLRINVGKSKALAVHPDGPDVSHAVMTIPVLRAHEYHRHLGMAVASAPSSTVIWMRTLQQVRATLHIAHAKTTNLLQRVDVAKAIIMPKLLFVGRHAWPTSKAFERLQRFVHQYVWHGNLSAATNGKRAWMSAAVAALPIAQGGIGLPDVQEAFVKMSAKVVARWCNSANGVSAAAGSALLRLCSGGPASQALGPSRSPPQPTRLASTVAATGLSVQRATNATPRDPAELAGVARLLPVARRTRIEEHWWYGGWYHRRFARQATELTAVRDSQQQAFGHFSLAALLAAPTCGSHVLQDAVGHDVARKDYNGLLAQGQTIGEVLRVERLDNNHVRFQCRKYDWPLPPRVADAFRQLCDVLVFNYPAVFLPQNDPDELQPQPLTHAMWRIAVDATDKLLVYEPVPGTRVTLGPVRNRMDAARLARRVEPTLVTFDHHPLLDAFAPIWTARERSQVAAERQPSAFQRQALQEVARRANHALTADSVIGTALAAVSWHGVARLPATASRQRLLFHKVKGLRLSGWDRVHERRGCPHCPTPHPTDDTGHAYHTLWYCPAAQEIWHEFRASWARLGLLPPVTDQDFCSAISR